jgi:dihydropyrimidinase
MGGVTTFIDYAIAPRDGSPSEYLKDRIARAEAGSCIDYSFHAGVTNPDLAVLEEFEGIRAMGIPSFKFFLPYRDWGFGVGLGFLMEAMREVERLGGVLCIHAEVDEIVEHLREKFSHESELIYHSRSRPDFTEELGIVELASLARELGGRLYVVHLTTEKGLDVIRQAQSEGVQVRTETCPHYLTFTDRVYEEPDGPLYVVTPPLRPPGNQEALWRGIQDGTVDVVASDHNALSRQVKEEAEHWLDVPPGMGGSELLLTFLHSEGVVKGRIEQTKMVELLSSNPAALFGVPNKGTVRVGYDADLVIFDPTKSKTVHHTDLATLGNFTPFEGMEMTGWPTHTISRGKVVVENRTFVGEKGWGRFVKRGTHLAQAWEGRPCP